MTDFASVVLGDRPGVVCLALGREPYRDERGRYRHRTWSELQFAWPDERDLMARTIGQEIATGDPVDIYVCPAVRGRWAKSRRKGDALPPMALWADLDAPPADSELFEKLNGFLVGSGRPGHLHLYVPLSEPVDLGTHARLNKALAARLGGDAKWSDESLLRLPGTFNWKPTVPEAGSEAAEKAFVTVVSSGAVRVWTVAELVAELGVPATGSEGIEGHFPAGAFSTEQPPDPLPSLVQRALAEPDVDRSRAHARLVGACLDAHLTIGQTIAVVSGYRPSVEKYGPRLGEEVTRFWVKAVDERQRKMHTQNPQNPPAGPSDRDSEDFGYAFGDPWNEDPTPLGRDPEPLPTDACGDVLGPMADAMAEAYQVPADLAVNLALPIITTAAAGRRMIRITPDWSETVALATLSALASGERKSPVQRELARPLADHERAAITEARPRIARNQAERKIAEDRAENLRKTAVKSGTALDAEMYAAACENLAEMPTEHAPRWLVDDITPEAIAQRLAEHGSIGAVSAEPGLFAILAGRYSSGSPNVENVLKATSGDPITVDRMGRDTIHVDNPCLSVSMCIQPGRLPELGARGSVFRNSGLLARLLYGLPAPRVGTRSISPKPVPQDVLASWGTHVTKLVSADKLAPELAVDPAALDCLNEFRTRLEPTLHPHHGRLAGIADWGSKLPGTVARIAAALDLLSDPYCTSISETTMAAAVRLGQAYTSHAQAAFSVIHSADDRVTQAREVLGWLRRRAEPTVSLREIHQSMRGRAWIESTDDLRAPLAVLVEHGHIRRLRADRTPGQPGRPSERYELHPAHLVRSAS